MSFINRMQRAVSAFTQPNTTYTEAQELLDSMIKSGAITTGDFEESKEIRTQQSKLDVRDNADNTYMVSTVYSGINNFVRSVENVQAQFLQPSSIDNPDRDIFMSKLWKQEPILAGAVYSMTAKATAQSWNITGRKAQAMDAAKLLSRAAYGVNGSAWDGFISASAEDFYTVSRGVFWETIKELNQQTLDKYLRMGLHPEEIRQTTAAYGKLIDIGHIDALNCTLTGNSIYPVEYLSQLTGQRLKFMQGEYLHFASMPSPREEKLGAGYCAVDRAYRAAKLLLGLHDYDDDKLSNLPPEGVVSVTGLTMDEFMDALKMWNARRKQDNSLTFPQVLWLIGTQPNAKVNVEMTPFSTLPESFDRHTVITQYINTLSLVFGVDAREFWTIPGSTLGGTGTESEIQHVKARGKGAGELMAIIERRINGELPQGVEFEFDTRDMQEDANEAAIAKAWVAAFLPLYNLPPAIDQEEEEKKKENPRPKNSDGSPVLPDVRAGKVDIDTENINEGRPGSYATQVINQEQFIRLLIDKGVLPDWIASDERAMLTDIDVHQNVIYRQLNPVNSNDFISLTYDKGILKRKPLPPIILDSTDITGKIEAPKEVKKEESEIRGKPIPESESERGFNITPKTIRSELELWRSVPELAPYTPTVEEEDELIKQWF